MADLLFGKHWKLTPQNSFFIPAIHRMGLAVVEGCVPPLIRFAFVVSTHDADAITAYKVNDHITLGFFTKDGIDGGSYQRIVSLDGKSLKVLASGRDANGAAYFNVINYEA